MKLNSIKNNSKKICLLSTKKLNKFKRSSAIILASLSLSSNFMQNLYANTLVNNSKVQNKQNRKLSKTPIDLVQILSCMFAGATIGAFVTQWINTFILKPRQRAELEKQLNKDKQNNNGSEEYKNKIQKLEKQLKEKQVKIEEATNQIEQLNEKLEQKNQQITELERQQDEHQQDLETVTNNFQKQIQELKKNISAYRQEALQNISMSQEINPIKLCHLTYDNLVPDEYRDFITFLSNIFLKFFNSGIPVDTKDKLTVSDVADFEVSGASDENWLDEVIFNDICEAGYEYFSSEKIKNLKIEQVTLKNDNFPSLFISFIECVLELIKSNERNEELAYHAEGFSKSCVQSLAK